jgi:hypothetical protein
MMTKERFSGMTLEDKIQCLYRNAAFIVAIRYYGYKINLYLLENFYVEVFYNHKFDRIEKIEPLERNTTREKFYADQISLPSEIIS